MHGGTQFLDHEWRLLKSSLPETGISCRTPAGLEEANEYIRAAQWRLLVSGDRFAAFMSAAEHYNAQVLKERLELHPEKHPSQWGTRARERNNIDKKADPLPVQDSTDGNIDKQAGPLPVQDSTDGNIDKQAGPLPVANRLREALEVLEAGKAGDEHDSDLFDFLFLQDAPSPLSAKVKEPSAGDFGPYGDEAPTTPEQDLEEDLRQRSAEVWGLGVLSVSRALRVDNTLSVTWLADHSSCQMIWWRRADK